MERYLEVQWGPHIVFRDTFNFLTTSLSKLTDGLRKSAGDNFIRLRANFPHIFPNLNPDAVKLLLRKGVFPYSYLANLEKLREPQLPPREAFYNDLADEECSEEDYTHAQIVSFTLTFPVLSILFSGLERISLPDSGRLSESVSVH